MFEKRYAFDLEFLVVARLMGFTRVFEAPVRLDYHFDSHIDPQAVARIAADTGAVFFRRYVLNSYPRVWPTPDLDVPLELPTNIDVRTTVRGTS
jgi:hypothetical protein